MKGVAYVPSQILGLAILMQTLMRTFLGGGGAAPQQCSYPKLYGYSYKHGRTEHTLVNMTYFHLKLFAALCMVIDHIGYVFYPGDALFRVIGRLSFPLFAWLLTQGESKTQNVTAYFKRLFIFALISQPFYAWLFDVSQLNVLVTLAVGLGTIRCARYAPTQRYLIWAAGIFVASVIPMDAGGYGLCVILLMAGWRSPTTVFNATRWWLAWIGLHIIDYLLG